MTRTAVGIPVRPSGVHGYLRVYCPLMAMEKHGNWRAFVTASDKFDQMKDADAILVQTYGSRQGPMVTAYLKALGPQVWLDLDDHPFALPLGDIAQHSFSPDGLVTDYGKALLETMQIVDGVITPNPFLASELKIYAKRVEVCQTQLVLEDWDSVIPIEHDGLWMGYMGAPTHVEDLGLMIYAVKRFLEMSKDHRFLIIGVPDMIEVFASSYRGQIMTIPWSETMKYYRPWVKSLDIALAPLQDTVFNRSKSDLKLLEYGICNTAVIASPCLYRDVFHYDNVLWARSAKEFAQQVEGLVLDSALRDQLARSLALYVRTRTYEKHWRRWATLFGDQPEPKLEITTEMPPLLIKRPAKRVLVTA